MAPRKYLVSEEMIPTLIRKVRSKECLWNPEDYNYNDRFHTLSAWRNIAKEMDIPEDIIKTKWKNLRDLFKREYKKNRCKKLENYTGKWKYFKSMWFIQTPSDYVANGADEENEDNQSRDNDETEGEVNQDKNPFEPVMKFDPPDEPDESQVYIEDADIIPDKRRRFNDGDYDMMYLQSLTPYFSELDPMRKLVVRSKINDLLMTELAAQHASNKQNGRKS
ncbi:uncharacterized protein LOC126369273 [Pectinophora gossypiella]|uniref:uncharacterized protein LOC126369273 n=1 Tax=Pectinophora gossypiella TaxID=13191 RepID=UPI00214F1C3B|nr:uncharacterized protein LOC126369273 [Pectinophora gossypiella]